MYSVYEKDGIYWVSRGDNDDFPFKTREKATDYAMHENERIRLSKLVTVTDGAKKLLCAICSSGYGMVDAPFHGISKEFIDGFEKALDQVLKESGFTWDDARKAFDEVTH